MGLDMYLTRKYYVKNWDHNPAEKRYEISIKRGGKDTDIPTGKIREIEVEVAYWRKANAIHNWFVQNVQEGEDNGQIVYVSDDVIEKLYGIVCHVLGFSELIDDLAPYKELAAPLSPHLHRIKVIKDPSKAREFLPCKSGFFFGSTEYDEFYYKDLVYTRDTLGAILVEMSELDKKLEKGEDYVPSSFFYQASW